MVALLAFFGFCNIYMLRVNLSVAVVAMTSNRTRTLPDGTQITVMYKAKILSNFL